MIYQPRAIQPTYKSIDGNDVGEISMVMNTTNYVSAYKLNIYDMDNNLVYQSSKTDFPNELYNGDTGFINLPTSIGLQNGSDYKWTARLYQPSQDMLVTYGNVIDPTTYVHTVGSSGLSIGAYYVSVNGKDYLFTTTKNLVTNDILSFDLSSAQVEQRQMSSKDSIILSTTAIDSELFTTLPMTTSGSNKIYTVPASGLVAGDYRFIISGTSYWFTTLSDLVSGDKITFNTSTLKLTQTYKDNTVPLAYVSGYLIQVTKSNNTTTKIYLKQNINIKDGMILKINNQSKEIYSYDVNTGLAIVNSPFSAVPTSGDKYEIYSDFIETTPENILYVRALPEINITNIPNVLTSKNHTFKGTYTQSDDVPMVYFKWDLYSVDNSNQTLIKSTEKVYSANIEFNYDGFKSGETYNLTLTCGNEYGIERSAQKIFSVSYDILDYVEQPVAEQTDEQGIRVSWMTATSTKPYSLNTNNASGYIQGNNNTSSIIWLERNQNIKPGARIKVGALETPSIIDTYNINNGYTTLSIPLNYIPEAGDYYYIYSEPDYDLTGINILQDTPYIGVNSAELNNNNLIYEKDGGLAPFPEEYHLTMQFLLDNNFFYGNDGNYNNMSLIARYEGNDVSGLEDLIIFARGYNFCAITPSQSNGDFVVGTITGIEEDGSAIYISDMSIDTDKQKYLCLVESYYIEYIQNYDSSTHKITFETPLPEENRPSIGSYFFLYDSLEVAYYDSVNNTFCLQNSTIVNPYADYVWIDSEVWNDNYYWLEGGSPIGRAANTWWKLKVTPNEIIVRKGGV